MTIRQKFMHMIHEAKAMKQCSVTMENQSMMDDVIVALEKVHNALTTEQLDSEYTPMIYKEEIHNPRTIELCYEKECKHSVMLTLKRVNVQL